MTQFTKYLDSKNVEYNFNKTGCLLFKIKDKQYKLTPEGNFRRQGWSYYYDQRQKQKPKELWTKVFSNPIKFQYENGNIDFDQLIFRIEKAKLFTK